MAWTAVKAVVELEEPFVLTPERYDPRRDGGRSGGVPLGRLVSAVRRTVTAADGPARRCVVFDTSDARDGRVVGRKRVQTVGEIGSVKKVFEPGDVIISRLRPYLRQVAFVDAAARPTADTLLLCSTEFHVLRSVDQRTVAFLVPYLLSAPVQAVLAAAQEGGHHPRFSEATLLGLTVPPGVLERREAASEVVERCAWMHREADGQLDAVVAAGEDEVAASTTAAELGLVG